MQQEIKIPMMSEFIPSELTVFSHFRSNLIPDLYVPSLSSPDFSEQQQLLRPVQHNQQVAYQVLHRPLCHILLRDEKCVC